MMISLTIICPYMCLVMSADKDNIYDTETIDEGRQLWSYAEAKNL